MQYIPHKKIVFSAKANMYQNASISLDQSTTYIISVIHAINNKVPTYMHWIKGADFDVLLIFSNDGMHYYLELKCLSLPQQTLKSEKKKNK